MVHTNTPRQGDLDKSKSKTAYPPIYDIKITSYHQEDGKLVRNFTGGSPYSPLKLTAQTSGKSKVVMSLVDTGCHRPVISKKLRQN